MTRVSLPSASAVPVPVGQKNAPIPAPTARSHRQARRLSHEGFVAGQAARRLVGAFGEVIGESLSQLVEVELPRSEAPLIAAK